MGENIQTNFTAEEQAILERLDLARLPQHIAVIMDGNGRWARRQGLPRVFGHQAGVESVRALIFAASKLGIRYLTVYSFSTENWERPDDEVHALMALIEAQLRTEIDALHRQGMRVRHLGRLAGLPDTLRQILLDADTMTKDNPGLQMIFAINYSGRAEIVDAVRRLAADADTGEQDPTSLQEDDISAVLYLPDVPMPDLLIRTGGDLRLSNFLLWEIAYTELWFSPVLWPDFRATHLLEALDEYQQRQRKYGRVDS